MAFSQVPPPVQSEFWLHGESVFGAVHAATPMHRQVAFVLQASCVTLQAPLHKSPLQLCPSLGQQATGVGGVSSTHWLWATRNYTCRIYSRETAGPRCTAQNITHSTAKHAQTSVRRCNGGCHLHSSLSPDDNNTTHTSISLQVNRQASASLSDDL